MKELVVNNLMMLRRIVSENGPSILTGMGVAGMLSTVYLAVKATPKALEVIEEEKKLRVEEFQKRSSSELKLDEQDAARKLTNVEVVKLAWKAYIPSAVTGLTTIACIVAANTLNAKRQAAVAGLYIMTKNALSDYQEQVATQFGKKAPEKIREAINAATLEKNPVRQEQVIITGKGKSLFFDTLSSRYFESDIEEVRKQQNEFNFRLINDFYRPLNEWYDNIGLDPIELGNDIGWRTDLAKLNILFDTKLVNDRAVIILNYSPLPVRI